mgnify:CR=1 FL=1
MTTSINNQLSQYKGEWQPNTDYKQYDLVHDGTSLWVADSDFTSGVTFDSANWTCVECP